MSLPDDLLEQARFLARREQGKPKQAILRRAVSAAYYALFRLLLEEAAAQSVPASATPWRSVAKRPINHGDIRKVCVWFSSGGSLPAGVPGPFQASSDLRLVAANFIRLQQERHDADYDTATRLTRDAALLAVGRAELSFAAWNQIRATDEGRAFLLLLFITDRWRR